MIFYRQGTKKPSNEPGMISGCLLIIGFGAIIFLLSLLESFEDVKEYFFQIILALFVGIGLAASIFQKKGHISNQNVILKNGKFILEKIKVPIENISIIIFKKDDNFQRYFLKDKKGSIAIFSIFEDDLMKHFIEKFPSQVSEERVESFKHDGPYVSVWGQRQNVYYDLDTGNFTIKKENGAEFKYLPEVYTYDPKYKLGKPLFKKA